MKSFLQFPLILVGFLLALLVGCTWPKQPESVPPQRTVAPPPPVRDVIVLQSNASPAYAGVTREILKQWQGTVEVIDMSKDAHSASTKAQASKVTDVVAIGLPAARLARSLTGKKVVFCQVFNYEGEHLVKPWMKGVSAMPPVAQQFKAWKEFNPGVRQVAVITGRGLQGLMIEAQAAARLHNIKLQRIEVRSNLAMRSAAKQLGPEVQGLWLVPDNRVLSHDVLREVLAESRSRGRQVLVMNEHLLSWGATLAAESDLADIASQALSRLRAAIGRPDIPGPALLPLRKTNIKTRPAAKNEPRAASSPIRGEVTLGA